MRHFLYLQNSDSDYNILHQYSDSNEITNNINVIIRTGEKEKFSDKYLTSMFGTTVNNIARIISNVNMNNDHQDYGSSSSIFKLGVSLIQILIGCFHKNSLFFLNSDTNSGKELAAEFLIIKSISDDISVFSGLISINIALFCLA